MRATLEVVPRPLRASLAYADKEAFARVAIVGDAEARAGTLRLRDMIDGAERAISLADSAALRGALS
jgi:histidyl-tRNA synthetase